MERILASAQVSSKKKNAVSHNPVLRKIFRKQELEELPDKEIKSHVSKLGPAGLTWNPGSEHQDP